MSRGIFVGFLCWFLFACQISRAEESPQASGYFQPPQGLDMQPTEEISKAELHLLHPRESKPRVVIILCPGQNMDGRGLLEDPQWRQFTERMQGALVALTFVSPNELLKTRRGYFDARIESGRMLDEALVKAELDHLPRVIFGFSAGAYFANTYALRNPTQLKAWCAYSASDWHPPEASTAMPALIACGQLDNRFGSSLMHFQRGRALGHPWIWVPVVATGHWRSAELEDLVRAFFAAVLNDPKSSNARYLHLYQHKTNEIDQNELLRTSVLHGWLPDAALVTPWLNAVK